MLKRFETIVVLLFLLTPVAHAKLQYLGIDGKILDDQLKVRVTVFKPESNFSLGVLSDIKNLTSNSNCFVDGQTIYCSNINVSSLNFEFVSTNAISKSEYYRLYDQFILPQDVSRVTCIITLPVGAILANVSNAVFPQKYTTLSNGRNILVYWELENVSAQQPLSFQVFYKPASQGGIPLSTTIKIIFIVVASLVIFFVSLLRQKQQKREEMILEVLDEYEKKIFDLVREHGRIKQRKLVELTGFSKARVSRIVRSLARRGLISVEHRGRNNIVKLKKRKAKTFLG